MVVCNQKCKYCYYTCCLLQNHDKEHKSPYEHKCKGKCSICNRFKCIEKDCNQIYNIESGHPNEHLCKYFHKCKENCIFKESSSNFKEECGLEYGHIDEDKAKIHYCNKDCDLKGKTKGCEGKCVFTLPNNGKDYFCGVQ